MMHWIENYIARKREARQRIERAWHIYTNGITWLRQPAHYRPVEQWSKWAKMQTQIISSFQQHWQDTYTYIRLHTYVPEYYADILKLSRFEEIATLKKDEHIYLFPDCQDRYIWEIIFGSAGLIPFTRTIFMLDCKPPNWQEVMEKLFEVTKKLTGEHSASEFENELLICRCLCYSMDEDLVIAKVDLSESTVLSILENVAREECLELVVHKRH